MDFTPPWHDDPKPAAWVKLNVAAVIYFKKHPTYLRRLALAGELPGARRYGNHWWIRLPDEYVPHLATFNKIRQLAATK